MLSSALVLVAAVFAGVATANPVEKRQFSGVHTGDATWYEVGLGACGINNVASDFVVAVSETFFDTFPGATTNPNNNPLCGQGVTANFGGRSIQVTIVDRCTACAFGDLDFSSGAFQALVGDLGIGRASGLSWTLNSLPRA
ncbi:hypothetical protein EXIGLDRAFT_764007 [Exidia glandulosa HHB12029]|uniref:RlpA-like protein double-psi beta-barrel domain-containing protein n=1 Tax=Exidia glandulosa HHB12029 TaxID=1314781 RepID=A0A165LKD5_EXIGL|nr:hypothetical protein EXIGLDRAFT_764007 [Exidia glandulosa HHB12029]